MKKIDKKIGQKFAITAAILMTRVFSTPLEPNQRRCMFAAGAADSGANIAPPRQDSKFDVVGLGFVPGREWKGPIEVFVEEMRGGEVKVWANCSFWSDTIDGPLYLLTEDPDVCFSFDGYSLVACTGEPDGRAAGVQRAHMRLREAALRLPMETIEQHRMM